MREHLRHRGRLRRGTHRRPGAIALVVLLAACGSASPAAAKPPPPLEPIEVTTVPLPPSLHSAFEPAWSADGEQVIFAFTSAEEPRAQIAVMGRDGTGFRCLTCGMAQVTGPDRPLNTTEPLNLGKPYPFSDGKRVLVRTPERSDRQSTNPISGPTGDFNYMVLECEPSLANCLSRSLLPIELPGGGLTRGVQNREARISPDGLALAWTEVRGIDGARMAIGRLVRHADRYTVADPRVLNPPFELSSASAGWRAAGPLYEFKRFGFDGRTVTYAAAGSASNFDVYELDLATGERRRITHDIEWDEDSPLSPDGGWIALFSSVGLERMEIFSQLVRPEFIEFATFPQIGRYMLTESNRKCLLEPWLIDREGHRGSYRGQPLNTSLEPGWTSSPTSDWSPDGTRILFWEDAVDPEAFEDGPTARLRVARLPARRPTRSALPGATPHPTWAPALNEWDSVADDQVRGVTIHGERSGTATLNYDGNFAAGSWKVTYDGYSDDGEWVLDGTEEVQTPNPVLYAIYTVDLTAGGAHRGWMRGRVEVRPGGGAAGSIESSVDGHTNAGLPQPEPCPSLGPARLRPVVTGSRRVRRGRVRVRFRVTGSLPSIAGRRPVRAVSLRAAGRRRGSRRRGSRRARSPRGLERRPKLRRRALTNRLGRAVLVLRGRPGARRRVRATAAGFERATLKVRLPRRSRPDRRGR